MKEQILLIEEQGSQGIACLGLATEVNKLSLNEKIKIIELISSTVSENFPKAINRVLFINYDKTINYICKIQLTHYIKIY